MSWLIDQNNQFFEYNLPPAYSIQYPSQIQRKITQNNQQQIDNRSYIFHPSFESNSQYQLCRNKQRIILTYPSIAFNHTILQHINFCKLYRKWENYIYILDKENCYLKISNSDKILYIYKQFLKQPAIWQIFPANLSINPNNGHIKINLTQVLHFPSKITSDPSELLNRLAESTIKAFSRYWKYFSGLLERSKGITNNEAKSTCLKIKKYMKKFGMYFSLANDQQAQNELNQNVELQKLSIQNIIKRQYLLDKDEIKTIELYNNCENQQLLLYKQQQLRLLSYERQQIKCKIRMPGLTKCKNIYQNNYILNCIKIKNYHFITSQPFNYGGFTNIYLADVHYWYVYSGANHQVIAPTNQQNFTPDKLIKKCMIIKRQQKKDNNYRIIRNRIQHQKNILKQIKSGNALFIPKYYLSTDQNQLKQDLLSDYVNQPNLINYIINHKKTLSLSSKIYILFIIIQGLRYLKLYKIVHLDLKPSNIMISYTMMIKIIDFGQSYHPQICPEYHNPGFTMPYSSPESYYPSNNFSQKNDIFSIGILAYEIIYGRFPFFLYNQKILPQIYKYKQYTNYWFYTYQQLENYGDKQLFPLLQLIIGKCLDPDPNKRPQLDWLCYIFRECIDFYR